MTAGLLGFTARKVASLEEASDLVHGLFVEIWNKRGQLQIQTSFRTLVPAEIGRRFSAGLLPDNKYKCLFRRQVPDAEGPAVLEYHQGATLALNFRRANFSTNQIMNNSI